MALLSIRKKPALIGKNILLITVFFYFAGLPLHSKGELSDSRTLSLKAAYIFNFTKFIKWPTIQTTIDLCLSADKHYWQAFQELEKKPTAYGRIRLVELSAPNQLDSCHILFVAHEHRPPPSLAQSMHGLLVISEEKDINGWVICLFVTDNKLRFKVNLKTAQAVGLKVSSKLLRLASEVIQ